MQARIKDVGADILFDAINHHNIHDVIALLDDGEADVNCRNVNGQTPLHYAVREQNQTMIDTLLHYNADPNAQENADIGGGSPLHLAVELNLLAAVDSLIKYQGDPTLQNAQGFTTLHIAAREGYYDMCCKLMDQKASK